MATRGRARPAVVAVPDANKIAAALIRPNGFVAKELQRPDTRFVAPAFLIEELTDHLEEYAEKAEVSEEELSDRIDAVAEAIDLVNLDALLPYADQELVKACDKIDPDDAPYFATYLAEDADLIWTSDKALREAFPDIARATLPVAGRPR